MGTRTITTKPVLQMIRIDVVAGQNPRVWVEGVLQDAATGDTVKQVAEDIFPLMTAQQKSAITTLVTKVTARLDEIDAGD
jgi:hypothetical protein